MKETMVDQSGLDKQLGDLPNAADILDAVRFDEASAIEPMADVVAVEQKVPAKRVEA